MRIRSTAAAAALALCSIFFVAPAGIAAGDGLSLVFDTWVPGVGECQQRVTFRVVPPQSGDAPAPTGAVRLVSESGAPLGAVSLQGFGEYEVTGTCEAADGARRVALAYDGDARYAATSAWSPDWCPGELETLSPEAWDLLVGAGDPQPVFMCRTSTGPSVRSHDGRLYARVGWSAMLPTPWKYGQRVVFSIDVDGVPTRQPTPPTGSVVARFEGAPERTFTSDASHTSFDWNVDTARALPGTHSMLITYSGDRRWAPVTIASTRFTIVRGRPTGEYSVKRWQLDPGQRPVVTVDYRNTWSRKAKAPTGTVSFYLGDQHVHDARLRRSDQGVRTVTLPPVRRSGTKLLRVVYRGDTRYKSLDSTGRHWFSSQQYIRVG